MYNNQSRVEYEPSFKARVDNALQKVRTILDNTRNPQYASDVKHEYQDKYLLVEFLTNSDLSSLLNTYVVTYCSVSKT